MNAPSEEALLFDCDDDQIVAILHRAVTVDRYPGILIVVGGPQYRVGSHRQFVLIARALAAAGFPVMRFDYRGMGDSGGDPRTFEEISSDIHAAIQAFSESVPGLPGVVVWGLCDAASAALLHATSSPEVCALILVNPWVRTESGEAKAYLRQYYGRRLLQRSFWIKLVSGQLNVLSSVVDFAKKFRLSRRSALTVSGVESPHFVTRMLSGLDEFDRPVLVLISDRDLTAAEFTTLCSEDKRWNRASAKPNVTIVTMKDADHTFSHRAALDAAVRQCVNWLRDLPAGAGFAAMHRGVLSGSVD